MGNTLIHAQTILQAEEVIETIPQIMAKWDAAIERTTCDDIRKMTVAMKERDQLSFDLIKRLLAVIYDE